MLTTTMEAAILLSRLQPELGIPTPEINGALNKSSSVVSPVFPLWEQTLLISPPRCQLTCATARKPNKAVKSVFSQKTLPAHCRILRYFATVRCGDGVSGIVTQGAPLGFHHSVSVSSCWMLFYFVFFYSFSPASFFMCQILGLVCSESWCFAPGEHSALSSLIQAFSVFMASWLDELQIRLDLKEESLCCSTSWGQMDDNFSAFYFSFFCLSDSAAAGPT